MYNIRLFKSHAYLISGKHSLWLLTSAALSYSRWLGVCGHHQPALRLDLLVGTCDVMLLQLEFGPGSIGVLFHEHQRLAVMTYT